MEDGNDWIALLDDGFCEVCFEQWDRRVDEFIDEHNPDGLQFSLINSPMIIPHLAEILKSHTSIKRLSINLGHEAWDLTPLQGIESLSELDFFIPHLLTCEEHQFPAFDFSSLPNLTACSLSYIPQFDSIFGCTKLRELGLNGSGPKTTFDLSRMPDLNAAALGCETMKEISWPDPNRLSTLVLRGAEKLEIGPEVGHSVNYLYLGGRLKFKIERLVEWTELRIIELSQIAKIPPLAFLLELPKLVAVNYRFPCGPNSKELSAENEAIIRGINKRSGYGDVLYIEQYQLSHVNGGSF